MCALVACCVGCVLPRMRVYLSASCDWVRVAKAVVLILEQVNVVALNSEFLGAFNKFPDCFCTGI